jgi:hypothetical protein
MATCRECGRPREEGEVELCPACCSIKIKEFERGIVGLAVGSAVGIVFYVLKKSASALFGSKR